MNEIPLFQSRPLSILPDYIKQNNTLEAEVPTEEHRH